MNPGRNEAREGIAFVGDSGKLLDSYLRSAMVPEDGYWITNAVCHRTPHNKEPKAAEVKACREAHFAAELREIAPKVIVTLGSFATKAVTGGIAHGKSIMPVVKELELPDTSVVPTYHPAAVLHATPEYEAPIKAALSFAWALANDTALEIAPKIVWVDRLEPSARAGVVDRILAAATATYDLETNAREVDDPDLEIYLCSIDTGDWNFVFGPDPAMVAWGLRLLVQRDGNGVGHNAIAFDARMMAAIGEPGMLYRTEDTMLLAWLQDERMKRQYNLEACSHRLLAAKPWKEMVEWSWHDTPREEIPWETAVEYCARDTRATHLIYERLAPEVLNDEGLARVYGFMKHAQLAFPAIERNGVFVRMDKIAEARARLAQQVGEAKFVLGDLNPNSPKQVKEFLADHGIRVQSTDIINLKHVALDHPELKDWTQSVILARNGRKMVSTYLDAYEGDRDRYGRVHPSYSLINTTTIRTACFNPNYENIPRKPFMRSIVGVPEGKTMLQADYSMMELRIAAQVSGESNMIAALQRGDDLHYLFAEKLTGKPRSEITKEERTTAKIANFSLLYGAEAFTFRENTFKDFDVLFSKAESVAIRDAFYQMWPELDAWHGRCADEIKSIGQIRSIVGTIRHLPGIFAEKMSLRLEALRQGINFTVQSPAALMGIIACGMLVFALPSLFGDDTFVVGFVHDAIHIETPNDMVAEVAEYVKRTMEVDVPLVLAKTGVSITVPIIADVEAGTSWGDLTKLAI